MAKHRGGTPPGGGRQLTQRLRTAKERSASSARWLERQLNDPYVAAAKRAGFRSRAAFKLQELDERFHLLKPGVAVVDLGAAPGGWTQVCVARVRPDETGGLVVAVDRSVMDPVPGATVLALDFMADDAPARLVEALRGRRPDVVLSDMAPPATGHAATDHLRIMALAEAAAEFALEVLAPAGAFLCKVWQGGAESTLLALLRRHFAEVRHAKPPASRSDSAETYLIARSRKAAPAGG